VSGITSDELIVTNFMMKEKLFDPEDPIMEEEDCADFDDGDSGKKGKGKGRAQSKTVRGQGKGKRKVDTVDTDTSKAERSNAERPRPKPKAMIPKPAEHIDDTQSATADPSASSSSASVPSSHINSTTSSMAGEGIPHDKDYFNVYRAPSATPMPPPATQPRHHRTPPQTPPHSPPGTPAIDYLDFSDSPETKVTSKQDKKRKPTSPINNDRVHRSFSSTASGIRDVHAAKEVGVDVDDDEDLDPKIGRMAGMIRSVNLGTGSVRGLPPLVKKRRGSGR
jgi:hypothetical protein